MMRKAVVALSATGAMGAAMLFAPRAALAAPCDLPGGFKAQYLVDFWRSQAAGSLPPDADDSARAPGLRRAAARTFLAPDSRIAARELDLVNRQLAIALDAVMNQPSLAILHGGSIIPDINMKRNASGTIEATLSIMGRGIDLRNPATSRRDGGYFTPGEGDHIDIRFNIAPTHNPNWVPIGACNGVSMRRDGSQVAAFVNLTGRPWFVEHQAGAYRETRANPAFFDASPPASRLQFLDIRFGSGSLTTTAVARGKLAPTHISGRLLAAAFMTDWNAVARKMAAVAPGR